MKKGKIMPNDPDMFEEYDFSKGARMQISKYLEEGCNVIVIDSDVSAIFPDTVE